MQQRFLLQILLLAQHVTGITMPIIRSSRVLYSGCCLWYFVLWFSSSWSGVGLRVMCPVCRIANCYSIMLDEVHILLRDSTNICRYITSSKLKIGKEYNKCSCKNIMSAQQSVAGCFIRKPL